jgi:cobalt-zinc-cadmium resistance protein CzcA
MSSALGEEKIYEIKINPTELANYNLSPLDVYEAVSRSNINVGGDVIQKEIRLMLCVGRPIG